MGNQPQGTPPIAAPNQPPPLPNPPPAFRTAGVQPRGPGGYVPCPRCGSAMVNKVGFSWWGGMLGPSLFCHCKCKACGATFNGKTGASNSGAIAGYVIVSFIVVAVIFYLLANNR